jgi:diacylglycerol kinase (ATP)
MALRADGEDLPSAPYHLVAVANTSTTGGGMAISPGADVEDGHLDVVTVGDVSRLALLRSFHLLYSGRHLGEAGVERRLVKRLEARSAETVYLNVDGEAVGRLPATFECLPKVVPFLLP